MVQIRILKSILSIILVFTFSCSGWAQERVDSLEDITIGLMRNASYIVTSPLRINTKGLLMTLGAGGFIFGVGRLDATIRRNIQHGRYDGPRQSFEDLEKRGGIERLGRSSGVMGVCGSFYAGGMLFKNKRARKVAYIGVESWLYNDLLIKFFKQVLGRKRPGAGDTNEFRSFSGMSSMPSGHAATAYCLASVIATEYDSWVIDFLSYGTASVVAFSRLYRDVHWASDIAASMVLGITIGKTTHRLYDDDPRNWHILFTGTHIVMVRKF